MNRVILFRGKSVKSNAWVYGWLDKSLNGNYHIYGVIDNNDYIVIPETIGQYTNLEDKNRDMIFEGDIVYEPYDEREYTVKFDEDRGGWFPFACDDGCGCCSHEFTSAGSVTIIGNIRD